MKPRFLWVGQHLSSPSDILCYHLCYHASVSHLQSYITTGLIKDAAQGILEVYIQLCWCYKN